MCANHSCSPVDISMAGDSMKLIWWYIAAVDEGVEAQGGEHQFHAYWISFEDSVNRLTFEADRDILRKAIEIVEGTSSPSAWYAGKSSEGDLATQRIQSDMHLSPRLHV